jgi:hypothetical protein
VYRLQAAYFLDTSQDRLEPGHQRFASGSSKASSKTPLKSWKSLVPVGSLRFFFWE